MRSPLVLVVEDDPEAREGLRGSLAARGFTAAGVGSAREAKRVLEKVIPDLLLLDLGLPDERGDELLHYLRASPEPRLVCLPVVVVSGIPEAKALSREADALFVKPVPTDTLLSTIWALVGEPEKAQGG